MGAGSGMRWLREYSDIKIKWKRGYEEMEFQLLRKAIL